MGSASAALSAQDARNLGVDSVSVPVVIAARSQWERAQRSMRGAARAHPAALVIALVAIGCAATPEPASVPIELPRIVESPEPRTCTAKDLETVTPWIGKVTAREPGTTTSYQQPRVKEQWAICGQLGRAACTRWAEAAAEKRATRDGLVAEVVPGTRTIGRLWTYTLEERVESRLFRNNGAAAAFLRTRPEGERFELLQSQKAIEPRNYRLEIVYRDPSETERTLPTSTWTWELPRSRAAAGDALLALEDLEQHGMYADLWGTRHRLEEALGGTVRPVPGSAEGEGPPLEVEVTVTCSGD